MKQLFAKLPDGKIVSRKTHHQYTHVAAAVIEGEWCALRWTKSPASALKFAEQMSREVQIVPVTDR